MVTESWSFEEKIEIKVIKLLFNSNFKFYLKAVETHGNIFLSLPHMLTALNL